MKIYLYIDESGSMHKNSNTKYFAVGGYFSTEEDRDKIRAKYKRINLKIKRNRNFTNNQEIKSYHMSNDEKIEIFEKIQDIGGFCGCVKVFNKGSMSKEIVQSNIFFNYAVKVLIKDCIIPTLNNDLLDDNIQFIISVDNRNIKVNDLKGLETYLKTEFCVNGFDFKITYYDSATNYGIQLADLIVNTFYNYYKDINIVKNVIQCIKIKNFKISLFPGNKRFIDNTKANIENDNTENEVDIFVNI